MRSRANPLRAARADNAAILVIAVDDIEASIKCAQVAHREDTSQLIEIAKTGRAELHLLRAGPEIARIALTQTTNAAADAGISDFGKTLSRG